MINKIKAASLFPCIFICLVVPLLLLWSSVFSSPPFSMPVCVTLSGVLSVPLLAFSPHFGDSNVKTHQLYPEQVSVPPGSTTWLREHKGKNLTKATDTSSFPKTMTLKLFTHPTKCTVFFGDQRLTDCSRLRGTKIE